MKPEDLLSPFGWLYGAIADLRQLLYRKGAFKSYDLQVATISVGNITVGGTGKTPLVAYIAEVLAESGEKVCILTRGYGRENPKERVVVSDGEHVHADALQAGDEPFELASKLLGKSAVIADAKRAEAGIWAREEYGISTFILDDGFQHVRVRRDLDVVLIDATNPFGNYKILPAGSLREPIKNLKRAHIVLISRANLVKENEIAYLKSEILRLNPNCKIFISKNKIVKFTKPKDFFNKGTNAAGESKNSDSALSTKIAAFCALGNPDNFFKQLREEGYDLNYTRAFSDHHFYAQSEILKMEKEAIAKGAEVLVTTAKDATKLLHLNFNLPCYIAESGLIFDNESAFVEIIRNLKHKNSD
jgi:tetraacyldisaccharide 4'-kinase